LRDFLCFQDCFLQFLQKGFEKRKFQLMLSLTQNTKRNCYQKISNQAGSHIMQHYMINLKCLKVNANSFRT
jgi:hypothetical protein